MNIEPIISFHHMPHSEALESSIRSHIEHLDNMTRHLISCRVTVEAPHSTSEGKPLHYRTHLELSVPGAKLIAECKPTPDEHLDAYEVVSRAFKKAERQLRDHDEKLRLGRVPNQGSESDLDRGFIVELIDEITNRHGFVEDADGRRLAFYEDALVDAAFEDLRELMAVQFYEKTAPNSPEPMIATLHVDLSGDLDA